MDAHMSSAHPSEHSHPRAAVYAKVGLVLFVLTALEVGLYDQAAATFATLKRPQALCIRPLQITPWGYIPGGRECHEP